MSRTTAAADAASTFAWGRSCWGDAGLAPIPVRTFRVLAAFLRRGCMWGARGFLANNAAARCPLRPPLGRPQLQTALHCQSASDAPGMSVHVSVYLPSSATPAGASPSRRCCADEGRPPVGSLGFRVQSWRRYATDAAAQTLPGAAWLSV
jgi:hypothetical protein